MSETEKILFTHRFGIKNKPFIDSEFPESARIGLWFVIHRMVELGQTEGWVRIAEEICRIHRFKKTFENADAENLFSSIIQELEWAKAYIFCERTYEMLLKDKVEYDYNGNPDVIYPLENVREDFERDINQLLAEENIVYRMKDGKFYRPGRFHSQKIMSKALMILQDPILNEARHHFVKAKSFFEKSPEPDFPNSIKEAVSAMEAAVKRLFSVKEKDFEKIIKNIKDVNNETIPTTIVNGILAPYRFRGAGQEIAHGGATGGKATAAVSEWALTVIAASIIYLYDISQSYDLEPPPF